MTESVRARLRMLERATGARPAPGTMVQSAREVLTAQGVDYDAVAAQAQARGCSVAAVFAGELGMTAAELRLALDARVGRR